MTEVSETHPLNECHCLVDTRVVDFAVGDADHVMCPPLEQSNLHPSTAVFVGTDGKPGTAAPAGCGVQGHFEVIHAPAGKEFG